MSSAGSPRLPVTIGSVVDLLEAESVNTTLWSDTACSFGKEGMRIAFAPGFFAAEGGLE